jgi:2-keto-4-pentenoate hydratase/2-oxohepta-3-ene-1,7-dioic acid hydratase in catechol pathway
VSGAPAVYLVGVRLVSFAPPGGERSPAPGALRPGAVVGDEVVDLSHPAAGLPSSMVALLASGSGADVLERAVSSAAARHPLSQVTLGPPVPDPPKVMAIGMNYRAHVAEMGRPLPEHQVWFNKQRTCVIGPGAAIEVPVASAQVDYEGELAFVIGRRCRHVPAADARSVVAGFTVMNDVSVRDWQWRTPTWTMGKSFDTHGPLGPWLVTPDEVGDPHRLAICTWVNGELRQGSST